MSAVTQATSTTTAVTSNSVAPLITTETASAPTATEAADTFTATSDVEVWIHSTRADVLHPGRRQHKWRT